MKISQAYSQDVEEEDQPDSIYKQNSQGHKTHDSQDNPMQEQSSQPEQTASAH